jgi:hypothetical protein
VHQVLEQLVDRFDRLLPETLDVADVQALAELAFLADHAAEAAQLAGHALVLLDDLVEDVGDLARQPRPVVRQADAGLPLLDGSEGGQESGHFGAVGLEVFLLVDSLHRGLLTAGIESSALKQRARNPHGLALAPLEARAGRAHRQTFSERDGKAVPSPTKHANWTG